MFLSLFFFPDTTSASVSATNGRNGVKKSSIWSDIRSSIHMSARPWLWPLLSAKVVSGVASSMFSTVFPLVLTQAPLNLDPAQLGLNMSAMGIANATFGAVGAAFFTSMLNGARGLSKTALIIRPCFIALAIAVTTYAGQNMPDNVLAPIMVVSVLHSVSTHALATGLTTQTTGAVSISEQGSLLGLEHGLFSLARIGGPMIATTIYTRFDFSHVGAACGILDIALLVLLIKTSTQIASAPKTMDQLK